MVNTKVVILGTAHGANVMGKLSPDKRLQEYAYSRMVVDELKRQLEADGLTVHVDIASDYVPPKQEEELKLRCDIVNALCKKYGKENCIYVSIHVNAAGGDGKWHKAGGWSAYTTVGKTKADDLAECLYDAARKHLFEYESKMDWCQAHGVGYDLKQRPYRTDKISDGDSDLEKNFYVLAHTACPAVLTENLFMDNENDVDFLLSEHGFKAIANLHREGIETYLYRK
ncbi:MAG: N-acetylmuramoyl-L-alanine amidase [Prevotella sp.]|nr:N-acetylmuramoyl-L-alanine amidase [Prevotella sp.]